MVRSSTNGVASRVVAGLFDSGVHEMRITVLNTNTACHSGVLGITGCAEGCVREFVVALLCMRVVVLLCMCLCDQAANALETYCLTSPSRGRCGRSGGFGLTRCVVRVDSFNWSFSGSKPLLNGMARNGTNEVALLGLLGLLGLL